MGIEYAFQQLICGTDILHPQLALLDGFSCLRVPSSWPPHIMVLRISVTSTRSEHIEMKGADHSQVNGVYTRVNSNCYAKNGDTSIRIFRYREDESWPAAW